MTITVSVTEDVTTLEVTETETSLTINPNTVELGVVNVAFSQASTADAISLEATGHITATNVQAALEEIGADPQFTSTLKNKLDNVEAEANKLTAGSNVNITEGTINADILGAISAGQNISISETGEISASAVSLTDVYTAANETEHLNLDPTPNQGDVVIRTDENKTYIHNAGTAGTMADYTELATTGGVNSINGATGVVTFGKANLDGYVANEFIDWTVSQEQDIHADNYTNTTYSAGANITIDENNQISATGGGGTAHTAGDGISIDNGEISLDEDHLYGRIKFSFADVDLDSGSYIEAMPRDFGLPFSNYNGIGFYHYDADSDTTQLLGGFTKDLTFTASNISVQDSFQINQVDVLTRVQNDDDDFIQNDQTSRISSRTIVDTLDTTDSSKKLVNAEYVQNAISQLEFDQLPSTPPHPRLLYTDVNGNLTWYRPNPIPLLENNANVDNQVDFFQLDLGFNYQQKNFDGSGGDGHPVSFMRFKGAGGTTVEASANNDLIITSTVSGLPEQSESTDGYVLTSSNSAATWVDLSTASLPSQTDADGKYLKSVDGTATWDDVDAYPNQENNSGKFLKTDGTNVSWDDVDALPPQHTNTYGRALFSGIDGALWATVQTNIPSQSTHNGKYLTTDGSTLSWATINTAGQTGNITFSSSTISSSDTDTVTVDDNLTATGTLNADSLIVTSASSPSVVSTSSYEITAPDGVTVNSCDLPRFQQLVELDSDHENDHAYTNNYDYITTKLLRGESQFEISVVLSNDIPIDRNYSHLEATWVQRGGTYEKVNVDIHRLYGYSYRIKLTDSTGGIANIPDGNLLIKIYEIL